MSVHRSHGVVRFAETDASGRFHFTSPLMWAENAEHELYRAAGLPAGRFPRRAVSATFERPLAAGDPYIVELRVQEMGNTSVTFTWQVLTGGDVAVIGSHTVVHVDESRRPTRVPDALRATLDPLLREAA